jgi:protocatechuate 4,5-dioxygenase beta chain
MARIVGGIGTSHILSLAVAQARSEQIDPAWPPLHGGYGLVAAWLAERAPDALVFFRHEELKRFSRDP